MNTSRFSISRIVALAAAATVPAAFGDAVIFSKSGSDADVAQTLDAYRAALGNLNPNLPGSVGSGRREINWDGVPDSASSPNAFPPDFFNANAAGRARGVVLGTPGSGFQNSADSDNPTGTPTNFANLNPQYGELFRAFSPQRIFTPIGSTITVVSFFVPGTDIPATSSGFGAIFSDVDTGASTELFYYDVHGRLLAQVFAPQQSGLNQGASFVGVHFDQGEPLARVAIVSGVVRLGPGNNEGPSCGDCFDDAVAMDDFVYGEPIAQLAPCAGDIDGSGAIDLADLSELLASFGTFVQIQGFNAGADLNANGVIDLPDLAALLARFGSACP